MMLHEVLKSGPKREQRWRVGRGAGSGSGKTAGRGQHGAYSRSGNSIKLGFEGGTMRFFRRLPRRGFNNAAFRTEWTTVNLGALDKAFAAGDEISVESVVAKGLVRRSAERLKVLADGEVTKALKLGAAVAVSAAARAKIEKAGGKVEAPLPKKPSPNFRKIDADKKKAAKAAAAAPAAEGGEKAAKPAKIARPATDKAEKKKPSGGDGASKKK
ncbi:MAG: 50S ribosomal protein L15 [Planctomycetes bacterium]|nr:50S ribosomal protein L15 [Planctomycetota bacterium]